MRRMKRLHSGNGGIVQVVGNVSMPVPDPSPPVMTSPAMGNEIQIAVYFHSSI